MGITLYQTNTERCKEDSRSRTQAQNEELLAILEQNPYENPPSYEKLKGDLQGAYSRRINIKHRLVYEVIEEERVVTVLSMWTHYE